MIKQYTKGTLCPYCKKEMKLDDIDINFSGNQNEYLICEKCQIYGYAKIRFGKVFSISFTNENGTEIFTIK